MLSPSFKKFLLPAVSLCAVSVAVCAGAQVPADFLMLSLLSALPVAVVALFLLSHLKFVEQLAFLGGGYAVTAGLTFICFGFLADIFHLQTQHIWGGLAVSLAPAALGALWTYIAGQPKGASVAAVARGSLQILLGGALAVLGFVVLLFLSSGGPR
jgi:hypothetical protein